MKRIIYIIGWLLPLVLLAGCENDVDLKIDTNMHQLVVNGFINVGAPDNTITVSLSGVDSVRAVTDAQVTVSVDGVVRETAAYHDGYHITAPMRAGDKVRIDVTTADHRYAAYVEETIPQPVGQIDHISAEKRYRHYYTNNESDERDTLWCYGVSFGDIRGESNYYRLAIVDSIKQEYREVRLLNSDTVRTQYNVMSYSRSADDIWYDDPIMMDGQTVDLSDVGTYVPALGTIFNKYGVFNDARFKDKSCTISVGDNLTNYPKLTVEDDGDTTYRYHTIRYKSYSIDVTFYVQSITKSEYNYLKSLNQYQSSAYDDNSDVTGPIKFPSNVHGGIGMVGFSISTSKTIHLQ